MENNNEIQLLINHVLNVIKEETEWKKRYANYINGINNNPKNGIKRPFNKPYGLSLYSSVSNKGYKYNLRFLGESVGDVRFDKEGQNVRLYPKGEKNGKYWKWHDNKSIAFRREYKKKFNELDTNSLSYKLHSNEHKVENRLLVEFNQSKDKALRNITPVKLYKCFFQMPTPLSASDHNKKPQYSGSNGGGIDILARVKPKESISRLCIIEIKDENENKESQFDTMKQAITYAIFIAQLLRSKSGQQWYDFFMRNFEKAKDGRIPKDLKIDVVTIMPTGKTEELIGVFPIPELSAELHCHSLYYNNDLFNQTREFHFSGTYLDQLRP